MYQTPSTNHQAPITLKANEEFAPARELSLKAPITKHQLPLKLSRNSCPQENYP